MQDRISSKSGDGGVAATEIHGGVTVNNNSYYTASAESLVNKTGASPLLRKLPLLFGHRAQKQETINYLEECHDKNKRLKLVVLHGNKHEGHGDFVERYQLFLLPGILNLDRDNKEFTETVGEQIPLRAMDWPVSGGKIEGRFKVLINSLQRELRSHCLQPSAVSPAESKENMITLCLENLPTNLILTYFIDDNDADLLGRWVSFWQSLNCKALSHSLTVVFCLRANALISIRRSWSHRFIETIKTPDGNDCAMIALSQFKSPEKQADSNHWAEIECPSAWAIAYGGGQRPPFTDYELKEIAYKAFSWWRKRPLAKLKPKLEQSLQEEFESKTSKVK